MVPEKLKESINSLTEMPERCMLAPENADVPFEVSQVLYGHKPHQYRVLITIKRTRLWCFTFAPVAAGTSVSRIR